jgi:PAT family beta-lactamase induction signal transducer AmpG
LTTVAILNLHHLVALEIAILLASSAIALSGAALGGWLSNITEQRDKNALSKWMNIALICGTGVAAMFGGEFIRQLPIVPAAIVLGAIVFLPTVIFPFMPAPGPDRRLASESFAQFNREVLALVRRHEVVIVLFLFLSPCSSFALTNLLGGLGGDFHATGRVLSLAGGVGAFVPGILGCTLFPIIAKRLPLRPFYFANGIVGSIFTLSLLVLPHAPWTFMLAVVGEYLFQAVAFSVQIGIVFEAIGPDNPLAATTFSFLIAATNVPMICMMVADGRAYSVAGVVGTFAFDAATGILTCLVAAIMLARFDSKDFSSEVPDLASTITPHEGSNE